MFFRSYLKNNYFQFSLRELNVKNLTYYIHTILKTEFLWDSSFCLLLKCKMPDKCPGGGGEGGVRIVTSEIDWAIRSDETKWLLIALQNINTLNNKIVTYNAWQQGNTFVGCIQLITFSDVQSRFSNKSTSAFRFHFFLIINTCFDINMDLETPISRLQEASKETKTKDWLWSSHWKLTKFAWGIY